ncbi:MULTISPECIES: hypothetical protein [Bifidobacterium]|uniref:Antitoxin VbhA domain-containing protein n=1 Tax=Bifidobacterium fermentum TaxID=3059035 RepID=A0AB39UFG3_9BIFI|nr:hypothetical protein [Bifidobacterium aquikefiri]
MIDEREKARRRAAFEDGIHSAYLDGGMVTDAFRADAEEYVNGLIDLDEMHKRLRNRYGIKSNE